MKNPETLQAAVDKIVAAISQRLVAGYAKPMLVVLDGRSGTGKSTLAKAVGSRIGAVMINGDDFYAGGSFEDWQQKTATEKVDQSIAWQRLRAEVLEPLLAGKRAEWQTFNWQTWEGLSKNLLSAEPAKVIILDGAYSARPEFSDIIDLSVLVEAPADVRRTRLALREEKEFMAKWHAVWDEAEDYYFGTLRPPEAFDLVVRTA